MVQLSVQFEKSTIRRTQRMLRNAPGGIKKVLAPAVNDTVKETKSGIAKAISRRIVITQKAIKPFLKSTRARAANPSSVITLEKSDRIPLKRFKPTQKKLGVAYKIKRSGGRTLLPHAFGPKIAKLNNYVFKREGKSRLPLYKPKGPSPWGVFVIAKANLPRITRKEAGRTLLKKIDKRVKVVLLKHAGKI